MSAQESPEDNDPLSRHWRPQCLVARIQRDAWKAKFADAVGRMAGKLHCREDCKCSARAEVRMLREMLDDKKI